MLSAGGSIDPDAIFQQFDLTRRGAVVAAVSGGSDSLALLFLLKDFLDRASPATRLVAVTIDHGLRAAAAAEAGAVAALCRRFGIAPPDAGMDGREARERSAGRGARGALPAARRRRGGGRRRDRRHRPYVRRPDRNDRHAQGARRWPRPLRHGAGDALRRARVDPAAAACAAPCRFARASSRARHRMGRGSDQRRRTL